MMTKRLITHLRHVDLAVPDYDKQLDFYTTMWGLSAESTDSGVAFLAAAGSPEQYVVRLRQADDKRIDLIAFGAASAADVDTLAGQLAPPVQLISEPVPSDPGGGYGFRSSTAKAGRSRSVLTSPSDTTARSKKASPSRSGSPTWSSIPPTPTPPARSTNSTWALHCRTP
jgi:catechol 2,3-dioxygenase-like lactoylglutathione lyase family enzyme